MGAYMIHLDKPTCRKSGCTRKPTCTVYNTLNQKQGTFCAKHGAERVDELNDPRVIRAQIGAR
jgi:hypothetical protein